MENAEKQVDLLVVGAGPAGSAAARRARTLGLSVLVIDRATFPRNKLCGGGLTTRSTRAIAEIFGQPVPSGLALTSHQVAFRWNGKLLVKFKMDKPLLYVQRAEFDSWLLAQAQEAGAEFRQATRILSVDTGSRTASLSDGTQVRFRALIGADGVTGHVARKVLGLRVDTEKQAFFAYEAELPTALHDEALMSIDFGIVSPGYGWSFPKFGGATIGLGSKQKGLEGMREALDRLIQAEGFDPEGVKVRGAFLPDGHYVARPGNGSVVVVGDAAGLADSVSGEGIAWALESGALAADAVAQASRPDDVARLYFRQLKPIHREFDSSRRLAHVLYARRLQGKLRDRLMHSETMRQIFGQLISGEMGCRQLERLLIRRFFRLCCARLFPWSVR